MQLLSGNYLDESIRKYAVNCLQQASWIEIKDYILQLVQALKYEVYHDSNLARYLLKLAIKYPLTIGHQLFWNLKSEMHNANVQQRFGLYLNTFLTHIHPTIRQVFEDEIWLVENLLKVADIGFMKNREQILIETLDKLNEEFNGRHISIPYNYKLKVSSFVVEKCKFMKSKKRPVWIVFTNANPDGDDIYVMFKKGDDLRQDILTLQLFKSMYNLWFAQGVRVKMSLYDVISTGYYCGMLEIVKHSETLASIQKEYGGIIGGFSDKALKAWMDKHSKENEYVLNFLLSCAAYCVATFVLGIGDRHNDNIMIKKVRRYLVII
jgi:phosphatidylinositol kinase/protein kinase (PI-3  family)